MGDRQAFADVVVRHGPALHRYARRLLHDDAATEDAVQEAFLAAWRGLPSFRGEAALRTWLFTLVRHQAYAQHRAAAGTRTRPQLRAVDPADLVDVADPHGDPALVSEEGRLLSDLDAALRLLPERQRSAWMLRELEELSYAEVGAVLDVTPTVVRGLLERARASLVTTLAQWR
ncbi:sigma-70 family RNA polymerase sigma factor [Kineococcus sp. R8]|nr:RNA polymerase sigma factor [Kineococcus siccus]NAZ81455.1 sigma-70 family RNA polymerase sigma factor [Kineococcus siccus]